MFKGDVGKVRRRDKDLMKLNHTTRNVSFSFVVFLNHVLCVCVCVCVLRMNTTQWLWCFIHDILLHGVECFMFLEV